MTKDERAIEILRNWRSDIGKYHSVSPLDSRLYIPKSAEQVWSELKDIEGDE